MKETLTEFQLKYEKVVYEKYVSAIIVAAGSSARMNAPKQLLHIFGIPIIARTMMCMQKCPLVSEIIVVAREEDIPDIAVLADRHYISKLSAIVEGGNSRQRSVENGVAACKASTQYYLIHDGARPLTPVDTISRVIKAAFEKKAAAAAVKVKDTIKKVDELGKVVETPNREELVAVQTPQVFEAELYRNALKYAETKQLIVTDDCMICEHFGADVYMVEGDYRNIKITTPEDISIAEGLIMGDTPSSGLS